MQQNGFSCIVGKSYMVKHNVISLIGQRIAARIGLYTYDWRMALAATWVLPIAFAITLFSARIQEYFNRKSVAANVD